jgi:hypothetical protein
VDKGTYENQTIIDYLLGSLPEAKIERLDELSITDDQFAARLQEVENDLVDSFVRGELSGETLDKFRSHYMSSPKRQEKVAFARGLQKVTDRITITEPAEKQKSIFSSPPAISKPTSKKDYSHRFFSFPKMGLQWGLAAAVLLIMIAGGWMVFENIRLRDEVSQAQAERESLKKRERELQEELEGQRTADSEKEQELASLRERIRQIEQQSNLPPREATPSPGQEPKIIAFALAPQVRGGGQIKSLSIPADANYVDLQLELEATEFAFYRAELKSQSVSIWKSGKLRAATKGDGKAVNVRLRSELFKSQIYLIEVSGISPTGEAEIISSYPFRAIKE